MDKDLEKKLIEKYPKLYQGTKLNPQESCMAFGFEHDSGWYGLIDKLSEDLTKIDPGAIASQVKEKFGTLRFYCSVYNDASMELIDQAEKESGYICEVCGQAGLTRWDLGWVRTLCDKHLKEYLDGREPDEVDDKEISNEG